MRNRAPWEAHRPADGGGPVEMLDVPLPVLDATKALVQTAASVISLGTGHAVKLSPRPAAGD